MVDAVAVPEELHDLVGAARLLLLHVLHVLAVEGVLHHQLVKLVHPTLHLEVSGGQSRYNRLEIGSNSTEMN